MKEAKDKIQITHQLTPELKQNLEQRADEEMTSQATIVRKALKQYFEA